MSPHFLVLGATGRIGSLVIQELAGQGLSVGGLVRDAGRAASMWPPNVTAVTGEFGDPASISAAMKGVQVVFVASPVHPEMASWQCDAVRAAAQAGVRRIVKLSGSAWTMEAGRVTTVGAAHALVEAMLHSLHDTYGFEYTCIRPNAFLQGMLGRLDGELNSGNTFSLAIGDAAVAFADIRDIAAAGAHAMAAASVPPLIEVTGSEAISGARIAFLLGQMLARPIGYRPLDIDAAMDRARASGMPEFTLRHQREVLSLLREGAGSQSSDDFQNLLGRPSRSVDSFLAEVSAKVRK
ncbi:NAD(P)H-binding protein [Ottowia sp. VDI28]|uniref:NAD(P)H-binding protein n=1 Tax=Ottowia sp. VDI28 TaxID=3133968 RepID=UPI003C2B45F7